MSNQAEEEKGKFDTFKDPKNQQGSQAGQFCMLAPAMVAVVIANEYNADSSPCGEDEPSGGYTIDLDTYLQIAGIITISWVGLVIICSCISRCIGSEENQTKAQFYLLWPAIIFLLFQLIWAGMGLYIYNNELSEDCQDTNIGKMILAWGIIQYGLIAFVCCCLCCATICLSAAMSLGDNK